MIKDREPKKYLLTEGVDILFGAARVVPYTLPGSGKTVRDLATVPDKLRITTGEGAILLMQRAPNGGWNEIEDEDAARNALADFEVAEVSKRAPKD